MVCFNLRPKTPHLAFGKRSRTYWIRRESRIHYVKSVSSVRSLSNSVLAVNVFSLLVLSKRKSDKKFSFHNCTNTGLCYCIVGRCLCAQVTHKSRECFPSTPQVVCSGSNHNSCFAQKHVVSSARFVRVRRFMM